MSYEIRDTKNAIAHAIEEILETKGELIIYSTGISKPSSALSYGTTANYSSYELFLHTTPSSTTWIKSVNEDDFWIALDCAPLAGANANRLSGTASWFAIVDSDNTSRCIMLGTCSVTGGTGDMWLDDISITYNKPLRIRSLKFLVSE